MDRESRYLSVIVPVYNEVSLVRPVLENVMAQPMVKDVIVVDDGSTDGTRDILSKLEEERKSISSQPTIKVIFHEKNQGKGGGIRTAKAHVTGELTIIQDADWEYNPAEYAKLVDPILSGEADVVYGSRFQDQHRKNHIFIHTFGNKFLTFLSNLTTGLCLTDMETCYKIFKTETLKRLPVRSNRFGFEPEITAKIAKLGCRVKELPISYNGRGFSEGKKINWKDGISAIWTIVKFWIWKDLG